MMEVVVTAGAIGHPGLQSNRHCKSQHPDFYRSDALSDCSWKSHLTGLLMRGAQEWG